MARHSPTVCSVCGQASLPDDRFCRHCGAKQMEVQGGGQSGVPILNYLRKAGRIAATIAGPVAGDGVDKPIHFDDVGGMDGLKRVLREIALVVQGRGPRGLRPWRSVLLFGPPGTGKTLIARALAGELGWSFRALAGSDFKSKYYGESEAQLHQAFEEARKHAPSVLFFDEVDSVSQQRSGKVGDEVLTQLLQEIEGFARTQAQILVLAATNLPWSLDDAFLSRMERRLLVPLPDAAGREAILKLNTRDFPLAEDVNFGVLARQSSFRSGRELERVCQDAAMLVWRDSGYDPNRMRHVNVKDFLKAIEQNPPTTSQEVAARHEQWAQQFATDATGGVSDDPAPRRSYAASAGASGARMADGGSDQPSVEVPASLLRTIVATSFELALEPSAGIVTGEGNLLQEFIPASRLSRPPANVTGIALAEYAAGRPPTSGFALPFDLWQLPDDLIENAGCLLDVTCTPTMFLAESLPSDFPRQEWTAVEGGICVALLQSPLSGKTTRPGLMRHRELLERALPNLDDAAVQEHVRKVLERLDRVLSQLPDGPLSPLLCLASAFSRSGQIPLHLTAERPRRTPAGLAAFARSLAFVCADAESRQTSSGVRHSVFSRRVAGLVLAGGRSAPPRVERPEGEVRTTPASSQSPPAVSTRENLDSRLAALQSRLQHRMDRLGGAPSSAGSTLRGNAPPLNSLAGVSSAFAKPRVAGSADDVEIRLYPAEWTGYVRAYRRESVLPQVIVETSGYGRLEDLRLKVELLDFSHPHEVMIPALERQAAWTASEVALPLKLPAFRQISERVSGRITASLFDSSGTTVQVSHADIPILAYNECPISADEGELIACFVQPNDPGVTEVARLAAARAARLNGSTSLCGYQHPKVEFVHNMVWAIYLAIQEDLGITYINPPPSFEGRRLLQRLRTPSRIVLRERQATCFDLALLFAACLEHVGLHPLVFLIRGHAFFGYFSRELNFPFAVFDDWPQVVQSLKNGDLTAVNSTSFCEGATFQQSCDHGTKLLSDQAQFEFAIDVVQARRRQLLPLPFDV